MPRVHTKTRSNRPWKREPTCNAYPCRVAEQRDGDRTIRPGDSYYQWEKHYGGPQRRHTECGYPRPTQLSDRKTAQIEEAIEDAVWPPLPDWDPDAVDGIVASFVSDLQSVMSDIAGVARDVSSEYEDSFNNMPDNFQAGATGEALSQIAEELSEWADELESWEPQVTEPDWPERDEDADDESYDAECQGVFEAWCDDARGEAEDKLSEIPEYQG